MVKKKRWQQRLEDFEKALARLEETTCRDSLNELEKDGVIQRFEFTYELAWKTLKDYLEDQGVMDVASPKKVMKKAYQENLFQDDVLWLQMLEDRNSLSHIYKQEMSSKIFQNIKESYAQALRDLIFTLKQEIE
ncbi:MAG: nucleotidyltransferase substrate binding protein [Candidatus Magnetoovum sp. WYHC-5]|nr:nucleotidyltransferase substrate binding protein [Candidatus Magnetoovum sp. WYHC-5]